MRPKTLGVVGLGALGGSVAWRAADSNYVRRVVAYSPVPREGVAAVRAGAVTEFARNLDRVVEAADFLVLAVPPKATVELLARLSRSIVERSIYCTDVASVKLPIVAKAEELMLGGHFAGSHPLAGSRSAGFDAAEPDMFGGKVVYVTPVQNGETAAAEVADFWSRVMGADPVMLDAEVHDETLAWTSHMPQAVASSLAGALAGRGPKGVTYGNGSRETTKRAECNLEMWTDILLLNRDRVLGALDGLIAETESLRKALNESDAGAVRAWLNEGRQWRERIAKK